MIEISIIVSILLIIILFVIFLSKKYNNSNNTNSDNYNNSKEYNDNQINNSNEYIFNKITDQRLKYIESGNIKTKKVMNIEENKIFYSMLKIFNDYNVNPQVSFRAFLKGEEDTETWKTFRDFYCDFLITYKRGSKINEPIAVIEYHGGGHFGDTENKKKKVENNDYIREKLFNKIGLKYFIIKDYDIKMKSGLIDEEKLNSFINNINNILSNKIKEN
ncbi:DUF2726 domain-containing protein [Brachyspira hyodysenteriae]|uniref:DUF2726 domain-containing protein n=1 Tax=Brachyspira hyodysenteriae TaxID=159 RepID=UPI0022CD82CB|nr:DUF2726 domain-containing protein [Brachyspira hyodysenteriae]MCZ9839573.1 DUF2726 domain-containing protein [Brachyspira hyodysenteriae]MCZ9847215.1 DUF2726 domain-containing protein [Brachyspira hyodysenteriae]MCZ9849695.1 DUF2726 domain-containing protein [Brachyspira hyodysenteriae]MCZ9861482.1 DUF2726 domain-containing protein [Brachyspira hyodysenteriae]MCZ9871084.1 DUF2726 domain-containing protein [Brachyspira hyodysenteriae]